MISAQSFLKACKNEGINFFTGTPCSYLKPFINSVIDDPECNFRVSVNEGEAVGLATGAWLGGKNSLVMFQNSGLGNALNPITSLSYTARIPFLGIVTLRGEPGGTADEPQHQLMGAITTELLTLMKVKWDYFPTSEDQVDLALKKAMNIIHTERIPYFFVMKKDSVADTKLQTRPESKIMSSHQVLTFSNETPPQQIRTEALKTLIDTLGPETAYIATTGKAGRELFELGDHENNFYMVGSMGLAPSIGLGLALSRPNLKVCVIDGDGALLMRMGGLATIGAAGVSNLIHILLNNNVHDSTGGQSSDSSHVDFALLAKACGYVHSSTPENKGQFEDYLREFGMGKQIGAHFIHYRILSGSPKGLGRPTVTPSEVATRFKKFATNKRELN